MRAHGPLSIRLPLLLTAVLWVTMLLLASGAFFTVSAHNVQPTNTDPVDGTALSQSPAKVTVSFPEEVVAEKSSLKVFDSQGKQVDAGKGGVDLNDASHQVMMVNLPQLASGVYTVKWSIGLLDGDGSEGTFNFGVGEVTVPTTGSAPTEVSTVTAASDPAAAVFSLPLGWIAGAAAVAVVVLVLVSVFLLTRRGGMK